MDPLTCAACLDIGGTSAKAGIVTSAGDVVQSSVSLNPVDSAGTAESILGTFAESLRRIIDHAKTLPMELVGVGVSICGPFDYENGISKITGLDKYEAIYEVNVKQELIDRVGLPPTLPVFFDVDSWAFARGEVWSGAGKDYNRVIVFTMGTGVGSAFAVDRKIVDTGPGVPWLGWISGQTHKDGMLNDYISRTYMISRYQQLSGIDLDVKEMAEQAQAGDVAAMQVFREVGAELGGFLRVNHVEEFGAECLIFGGRISYAFNLFEKPLRDALSDIDCLKEIVRADDIESSALKGAARYVFDSAT